MIPIFHNFRKLKMQYIFLSFTIKRLRLYVLKYTEHTFNAYYNCFLLKGMHMQMSLVVRPLFVCGLLFVLFRTARWPSTGKKAFPFGFLLCCLTLCRLNQFFFFFCVPFPFGVWGRMWNSIVSVPDHCLFIYFF